MHINHRRKNKHRSYQAWGRGYLRGWVSSNKFRKLEKRRIKARNRNTCTSLLPSRLGMHHGYTVMRHTFWY